MSDGDLVQSIPSRGAQLPLIIATVLKIASFVNSLKFVVL